MSSFLKVLLLFVSCAGSAQQFFPKGLSESEKSDYKNYIENFSLGDKSLSQPPSEVPRTPAEYEEAGGLIISWANYSEELREIVEHASLRVAVHIIASDPSGVQNFLSEENISMENIIIRQLPFNSVWVRDYGPQSIYLNGTDELAFVNWLYNRPHRPDDNLLPENLAAEMELQVFHITSEPNRLIATGGNFMTDGHGTGFSSKLILTENPNLQEQEIDNIKYNYMGINRYIKMDELPYDNISHLDMHMKLLDEETLLVGEFPNGVSDGPYIESNLEYLLSNYQSCYNRNYEVIRIPMIPSPTGNYPDGSWNSPYYRTFTNALILNDLVLVPQYHNTSLNQKAIQIYQEAMPGYEIIGINMENVIPASGAIHCITREIAATDPVFISHARLREMTANAKQPILEARVESYSGMESVSLYFALDRRENFTEVPMDYSEGIYSASLPEFSGNSNIFYYISATNKNQKTITKPFTGPKGAWEVNFTEQIETGLTHDHIKLPLFDIFPNPAQGHTNIVYSKTFGPAEITILNLQGKVVFRKSVESKATDSTVRIPLQTQPAGVYIVQLRSREGISSQKLIIQ